jgi:hypothetical protein
MESCIWNELARQRRLTIVASGEAMAFQQALGMKFVSDYPEINAKASERFEDIETPVTDKIGEANRTRTPSTREAGEEVQRLFHGCSKTQGQFVGRTLIELGFCEVPMDLAVNIFGEPFRSEYGKHQAALT